MANILFVAYDYPPILSPESIQVQRRALTLANNGHKVFVLTAHLHPAFEFIDKALIENHENIKIINTRKPILEKVQNLFFKLFDLTDRKYWWRWFAIKEAKVLVEKHKIDSIYTHSTPLVDHLVGLDIKKEFPAITWIAHFSDPWTLNPYKSYQFNWQYSLNRRLEQKVLEKCDKLTVTSEKTKELFENSFQFIQSRIYVLPHTFDERYFVCDTTNNTNNKIVVHTGNIYGLRTIKYFLEALQELKVDNVEFHFYGKIKEAEIQLISDLSLNHIIKVYSQIPYLKSLEVILNADYLMVVDAPLKNSPFFPSKLADYIGAKKPIIALSPKDSTTVEILKHIKNDKFIASSNDTKEIKNILENIGHITEDFANFEYYSMKNYNVLKEVFEK